MSEAPLIRVGRAGERSWCPFCKDEVTSGPVWVCTGCDAPHHVACHDEHGGCSTCGVKRAPASAAREAEPAPAISRLRDALRALGFTITFEHPSEVRARSASSELFGGRPCGVILVATPGRLTRAKVDADHVRLTQGPSYAEETLFLHLADSVDANALEGETTPPRLAWSPVTGLVGGVWTRPHEVLARRLLTKAEEQEEAARPRPSLVDAISSYAPAAIPSRWLRFAVVLPIWLPVMALISVLQLIEEMLQGIDGDGRRP